MRRNRLRIRNSNYVDKQADKGRVGLRHISVLEHAILNIYE